MKRLTVLLCLAALFAACKKEEQTQTPAEKVTATAETKPAENKVETPKAAPKVEFAMISVEELDKGIQAKTATAVDANGVDTRKKQGTIPGAVILTDYKNYNVSELPADKAQDLVFYCANEVCSASHKAAAKAKEAGYQKVAVLPAGIAGWKEKGMPTEDYSETKAN